METVNSMKLEVIKLRIKGQNSYNNCRFEAAKKHWHRANVKEMKLKSLMYGLKVRV